MGTYKISSTINNKEAAENQTGISLLQQSLPPFLRVFGKWKGLAQSSILKGRKNERKKVEVRPGGTAGERGRCEGYL